MNQPRRRAPSGSPAMLPGWEAQNWSFYDFQTYAAAGQAQLTYFQTPVGAAGRTLEDTNFPGAGALPRGFQFVIQEVQCLFLPGVQPGTFGAPQSGTFLRDVYAVGAGGVLQLDIIAKTYIQEGPLGRFPPDTRLMGFSAAADASTAAANLQTLVNYAQWGGRTWAMRDQRLDENVGFVVTLSWPRAIVPLPSTVAGRLGVFLRGILYRRPQ